MLLDREKVRELILAEIKETWSRYRKARKDENWPIAYGLMMILNKLRHLAVEAGVPDRELYEMKLDNMSHTKED